MRLKALGIIQKQEKQGIEYYMNWNQKIWKDVFLRVNNCSNGKNWKVFLHRIVTGDEKWIHNENPKWGMSWGKPGHASTSTAKPNIHGSKLTLCIWWDQQGIVYYELLQSNKTITKNRYRFQLMRLSRALKEKRSQYEQKHEKVILQHGNARSHVAQAIKTYLETLDVLLHPPYSRDIAPSDYLLFRSTTHGLSEQKFSAYEDIKKLIDS